MKDMKLLGFFVVWMVVAQPVAACEPVVPLVQLFSGALATTGSLYMLCVAILLKALAFIVFERRLSWYFALLFMVIANLVSTCIGVALSVSAAAPFLFVGVLPVVYLLSNVPAKRVIRIHPRGLFRGWNAHLLATLVTGLFIGTWFLFGAAQTIIAANEPLVAYWVLKFLYVYSALIISMGLTTVWEEWIVAVCARKTLTGVSYYGSVVKANLVASFVIFGYAAIMIFPERLRSSDFLVQLLGP